MRADRLLSLLMLLQIKGQITAQELARRLEVSERTIYRDIEALSMAGIPVYAERGPGGGCTLAEGYRTSLTGLTESEVHTLFISGATSPLADLGMGKSSEAALLKLLAALPSAHRSDIERTRQRLYLDTMWWYQGQESVPFLQILREAIWQDHKVYLAYRNSEGIVSERVIEPLALVAKAGVWYVVAVSKGELRVFRVSRVRDAVMLDESYERPEDFDLETYWKTWCEDFQRKFPPYPVKLRIAPEFVHELPQLFGETMYTLIEKAGPPDDEGRITLTLEFGSFESARSNVLGFGSLVEVLDPQELRESVIYVASSIAEFYKARRISTTSI